MVQITTSIYSIGYVQWFSAEMEAMVQDREFCFWSPYSHLRSIHQLPLMH